MTVATTERATPATESPLREGWVIGIVAACVLLAVANTTMVNVALPTIGERFDANAARLGWLVTAYALTFGVGTPFYGRLGDRYGLRRMFVVGLSVFVVASVLAGLSTSFPMLLVFRSLQAAGSAAIPSLGLAMIARTIPQERRGRSLGWVSMAVGAGAALGPSLGGALTQLVSWRMVFLVSAVLGLVIPLALRHLPHERGNRDGRIDWVGGITLGAAIAGLLLVTAGSQRQGLLSSFVIGAFGIGIAGVVLTVWRQRVVAQPFVDRLLVANRRYLLLCLVGFSVMAGNVGALVTVPFYLSDVHGLSAGQIGLALLPAALAVTLFARPAGRLADAVNPFLLISIGNLISAGILLALAVSGVGWPVPVFAGSLALLGIGQSLAASPLTVSLTIAVPQRVYGSGLGIYNMLFFAGSGFGAALSTAVLGLSDRDDPLLPFHAVPESLAPYSNALLTSIIMFLVAFTLVQVARRVGTKQD